MVVSIAYIEKRFGVKFSDIEKEILSSIFESKELINRFRDVGRLKTRKLIWEIFGIEISDKRARRIQRAVKFFVENFYTKDNSISEIKSKIYEQKIKNKIKKHETENLIFDEIFVSAIKDSLENINVKICPQFGRAQNTTKNSANKSTNKKQRKSALLILSDWHILEPVNPEEVNYVNGFDLNIAARRVELISEKLEKIISLHKTSSTSKIDKLYIWLGGDMVSGIIHDELLKHNDLTITDQIALAAYLIAFLIFEISTNPNLNNFKEINIFTNVGNHGRLTKKKEYKKKYNSFDYITYQLAALIFQNLKLSNPSLFKNKKINFEITKSIYTIKDIENRRFVFTHGDEIKSWNSIPFYGLLRDATTKQNINFYVNSFKETKPVEYLVVGHFHVPSLLSNGAQTIIMNGTLKGVDEYSFSKGFLTRPSQKLLLINEKHGLECTYDLWLDEEPFHEMKPKRIKIDLPEQWASFYKLF